jgi:hypothetical protein
MIDDFFILVSGYIIDELATIDQIINHQYAQIINKHQILLITNHLPSMINQYQKH